ncbi:MAG TPA: hypothetical protein VMC62_03825 [Longilinea sp.]|nr:hypothetical protein [Longilinea sp.]
MAAEKVIDAQARDVPVDGAAAAEPKKDEKVVSRPTTLKDTLKSVENIGQTLGDALQGRGNVVMVRVNDETLHRLDMLVEAEITKSRSESAAYLISEGIKATEGLYARIGEVTDQIARLREQLREAIKSDQSAELSEHLHAASKSKTEK